MRVVFAGTPEFSIPCLQQLLRLPWVEVVGIYTQPDRLAGRGRRLQASPVKHFAVTHECAVFQPTSFKNTALDQLSALEADIMVVVAYGLLLPQDVLDTPKLGCVNLHASLLPRWRGAAPIQRAIDAGDTKTGVTLMQMESALDSGPILAKVETKISDEDTAGSLHDRLAQMAGVLLKDNMKSLSEDSLKGAYQQSADVTYARKLSKQESALDWQQSACTLERKIRAFNPWPGAVCRYQGKAIRVHQASFMPENTLPKAKPSEIVMVGAKGIVVQTGDGQICLEIVQRSGGKAMLAKEFLNGMPIKLGQYLQ